MSSNPFARKVVGSGEGSRPSEVWRGAFAPDGSPVYETIDWDSGKYVAPNSGQYTLMIRGYTEPQIDTQFPNQKGEYVEKFAIELEIARERGKGFRFFWSFQTPKISFGDKKYSPSNLGRVYLAALTDGVAPAKGTEVGLEDLFDKPFDAYVVASVEKNDRGGPKYAKVTADTISAPSTGDAGTDPFAAAMATANVA